MVIGMTEAVQAVASPKVRPGILAFFFLLVSLGVATGAAADGHDDAYRLRQRGEILPLERILDRAQSMQPGSVLEVELERKHGRYVYEVEILDPQGVVWELKLDAGNGELISTHREH
jgi:uncharacterized membrane protein YkoI